MSSSTGVALNLGAPPSEKLARGNFILWKTQVLPALRGAQVTGLLDNSDAAPPKMVEITKADKTSAMDCQRSAGPLILTQFYDSRNSWTGRREGLYLQAMDDSDESLRLSVAIQDHKPENRDHHNQQGLHVKLCLHGEDEKPCR